MKCILWSYVEAEDPEDNPRTTENDTKPNLTDTTDHTADQAVDHTVETADSYNYNIQQTAGEEVLHYYKDGI